MLFTRHNTFKDQTDSELIQRIISGGDEADDAFYVLYQRYKGRLHGIFYNRRVPKDDWEDLAQRIWVRVVLNLEVFDQKRSFQPWLSTIAQNHVFNYFRDRNNNPVFTDNCFGDGSSSYLASYMDTRVDIPDDVDFQNKLERVETFLATSKFNGVVELRLQLDDDCSYEEIAARQNLKLGTVKSRIARARKALLDYALQPN